MDSKRLWIVMLVVAGGLLAYTWYTKQKQQPQSADTLQAQASPTPSPSAASTVPAEAPAHAATAPTSAPAALASTASEWNTDSPSQQTWSAIGSLDAKQFPFQLEITTEGAAVGTLKLASYYAAVQDKQLANKLDGNEAAYEKIVAENPGLYHGHYSLMNPVTLPTQQYLPMATRRLTVLLPGREQLSWRLDNRNWVLLDQPRTTQPADGNTQSITYSWTLYRDPNFADAGRVPKSEQFQPFLRLYKTYTVTAGDQSVQMSLEAENLSGLALKIAIDQGGPAGVPSEDPVYDQRSVVITQDVSGSIKSSLKPLTDALKLDLGAEVPVGFAKEPSGTLTLWVGEINKFFGTVLYIQPSGPGSAAAGDRKALYYIGAAEEGSSGRTLITGVTLGVDPATNPKPALELAAGERWHIGFDIFAGPKRREMFDDPGAAYFKPLYRDLKYINTIDFGQCSYCTCSWLALGMMWLLQVLSKLSFGNYGVAIILLVILVRLVLHPLTKKSQVMMMKTQKLAPQMAKLKAKYADDKDTLNKEMMKMYKQQGATPLLGCLPMLLQMPVLAALYGCINASVELRHAAFLPFWLTDLAAPDNLVTFSTALPLMGHSLHLLPILVAVSMFFVTLLNPQMAGGGAAATPEQAQQQKMMKYMMPVMMLFMFYSMPSGLNLYFMAANFAGVAEQYVIRKHIQQKEALEASVSVTVDMPGKAPRGSRTKKPKGPFFTKH